MTPSTAQVYKRLQQLPRFQWSEDGTACEWKGLDLVCDDSGFWMVMKGHHIVVSCKQQVKGENLQDAQRRAQAAAMVYIN